MTNPGALKITTPSDREIVITRVFDAPRTLVWDALTKPELLRRWMLGPDGWTMVGCDMDLRVGGAYRWVWRHPQKPEMGVGGVFREIVAPQRLVHTEKFDQAWYAGEALVTNTLTELSGRTTLKLTILYESKATRDSVLKSPMEKGVGASYDRLERMLAESKAARA